jgi:hypothetical protein
LVAIKIAGNRKAAQKNTVVQLKMFSGKRQNALGNRGGE